MLVCCCVNPPPVDEPGYHGVYFSLANDLPGKAKTMRNTPVRLEHQPGLDVGRVPSAWTVSDGRLFALAELDTRTAGGAIAATYVKSGRLQEFSLGYVSKVTKCPKTGGIQIGEKEIRELSIVREGARPGCTIVRYSPY